MFATSTETSVRAAATAQLIVTDIILDEHVRAVLSFLPQRRPDREDRYGEKRYWRSSTNCFGAYEDTPWSASEMWSPS